MSTRVTPEEYGMLTRVPKERYVGAGRFMCEVGTHDKSQFLYETPDHRSIEVCTGCANDIEHEIRKRNEL